MLNLEVRKKAGGTELHRVNGGAVTVGASSGNEVVVRARGVAGRHVRIFEKDGGYHLDLYKGVDAVTLNGQVFQGGPISPGDRITIGEATITITPVRGPRQTPVQEVRVGETVTLAPQAAPLPSTGSNGPASAAPPATEVEYRTLRLSVYRLCR